MSEYPKHVLMDPVQANKKKLQTLTLTILIIELYKYQQIGIFKTYQQIQKVEKWQRFEIKIFVYLIFIEQTIVFNLWVLRNTVVQSAKLSYTNTGRLCQAFSSLIFWLVLTHDTARLNLHSLGGRYSLKYDLKAVPGHCT